MNSRASLRTTRRPKKIPAIVLEDDTTAEDNDAFSTVGSPRIRRLQSPVTPKTKHSSKTTKKADQTADESLGPDLQSQQPTPSKWSSLLPDYFGSQLDEAGCDVLWDCSSPDAIRHLRRRKKNSNNNLKEIVKHFKAVEPSERTTSTSPLLQILRSSLQQQMNGSDAGKSKPKKPKRSSRRRKEEQDQQQELLAKILYAVERKAENSRDSDETGQSVHGSVVPAPSDSERPAGARAEGSEDALHDDSWGDDDLFENDSFLIQATQNPDLFLNASGTSTPKCSAGRQSVRVSQQPASFNSTGALNSQNSEVIPPTLLPADSKPWHPPDSTAGSRLIGGDKTSVPGVSLSKQNSLNSNQSKNIVGMRSVTDSPKSRFRSQKHSGAWPRRVLSPALGSPQRPVRSVVPPMKNVSSYSGPHMQSKGSVLSANQRVDVRERVQTSNKVSLVKPPSVSRQVQPVNSTSTGPQKSGHSVLDRQNSGFGQNSRSSNQHKVSGTSTSVKCVMATRSASNQGENIARDKQGAQNGRVLRQPVLQPTSSKVNSDPSSRDDAGSFDDSLSDDLLLTLTEQDDMFESQMIQEFPTQAPQKPACSLAKPPATNTCDFDDMDYELLASICEFDSFSETPQKDKAGKNQQNAANAKLAGNSGKDGVAVLKSRQASAENKQSKPRHNDLQKPLSAAISGAGSKRTGLSFQPTTGPSAAKGPKPTPSPGQTVNGLRAASGSNCNNVQNSKSAKPAAVAVSCTSTLGRRGGPLSTLATSNMFSKGTEVQGKKFSFKPLSGITHGQTLQQGSVMPAKMPVARVPDTADNTCTDVFSQEAGGDPLADDALFESQIIAMLDQVESQVSQQVPDKPIPSPQRTSPLKCSQEEIEKKRQAAVARRLRSASRAAGKPR